MARFFGAAAALAATASALTPEQFLSLPKRGVASANPAGTVAVFTTSQYSFETHKSKAVWQLLDLNTGNITDSGFSASDVNEIAWLPGTETGIIYINGTNDEVPGGVTLWIGDILRPSESKLVASLDAPFNGLKVAKTPSGDLHYLVNTLAYPNGTAYNPETAVTARTTARFYENIYTRHWDTWLTKQRYAVFGGSLPSNSSYSVTKPVLRNLLQGVNYTVTRPETPVQPFGGSGDYDISPDGSTYAFLTKATHLSKANFTASYIYLGPFDGSAPAVAINGPDSEAAKAGHEGASSVPTFSPDSSKLAYVQQDEDFYESDRLQLYVVDVKLEGSSVATSNWKALTATWDRWVESVQWAPDSKSIFTTGEDHALEKAYNIPIDGTLGGAPKNLTGLTSVAGVSVLPDSSLLVSASAIWTSRDYYIVSANGTKKDLFSSTTTDKALASLGPHLVSEIYTPSSPGFDQEIQSIVTLPSNFSSNKTYPLAFIIHGGPQGSNPIGWGSRWNTQVWADQGYVVVAPNPAGSTGFGQELTDRIQGNWGSYPYEDLVLAWNYVKENLSYVDTDNGIAAGASYGGYMTNWIQGQPLGREFKALVTHDGISNTLGAYGTEELWFIDHDYNGTVTTTDPNSAYTKWNPFNHIANFSTPQFIIHNSLDYRLPESDGLALFNVLQIKGVPSRFLNFPDENHWVLNPENSFFWHTEIFNWINHYSKGTPLDSEPIGE
ncbi:hypothetical protein P280DRAFT_513207 [Massarina eburnea CBS 473.64]|uniref:Dipeptidyl-peptidase V n=1 Tax=Massarina eburnea CBS 473.64 TaxID=1395130 RepID=A0A6A6SBQ6_9PLEO|nr:hypothetical protein P280DRAFT_513207 [Massarina eburnea CBS 473.64]